MIWLFAILQSVEPAPAPVVRVFDAFEERCAADDGQLWGISFCGTLLVVDHQSGVVYSNQPGAGEGWVQSGSRIWINHPEQLANVPRANTAALWQDEFWAVIQINALLDQEQDVVLALHESFHRIQGELSFTPSAGEGQNSHLDEMDARILLRLQIRALSRALSPDANQAEARVHLRNALIFANQRHALFEGAAQSEAGMELNEGVAEYSGWRLSGLPDTYGMAAVRLLERENAASFTRSFAYATGPGVGLALDRLGHDWRDSLNSDGLVAAAMAAVSELPLSPDISAIGALYGYADIHAEEQIRASEIAALQADYIARFVDGPRLILPLGQINFDPRSVTALGDAGQVYRIVSIEGEWGQFSTQSGALLDWNNGRAILNAPESGPENSMNTPEWSLQINDGWGWRQDGQDYVLEAVN